MALARDVPAVILYRHRLFREVMTAVLEQAPSLRVVGATAHSGAALRLLQEHDPQVIVIEAESELGTDEAVSSLLVRMSRIRAKVLILRASLSRAEAGIYRWERVGDAEQSTVLCALQTCST